MCPEHDERRQSPRFGFSIALRLNVLAETTFPPSRFEAESCDLSAGGILVEVGDRAEDLFEMLAWEQRKLVVRLPLPRGKGEAVFPGEVVWYDYRRHSDTPCCRAGIVFEMLREPEQNLLVRVLQQLDRKPARASS